MLAVMSEPSKKPRELKNPEMVFVRMDDETRAAFEKFMGDQPVTPERPAVVLTALRDFLRRLGYLPKRKS
jgi:hypothetical protein